MRKPLLAATAALIVALLVPTASGARSVYVGNINDGRIEVLTQDTATGVLTPASSAPSGTSPTSVSLSPDGKSLYAGDYGAAQLYAYDVSPDGSLTAKAGSPYAVAGPTNGITVTANGKYLYAASSGVPDKISGFAIAANGTLTPLPGSPYTVQSFMFGIASSPDSKLLYVTTTGGVNRLYGYAIGADGTLTAVPATLPVPGADAKGVVFSPDGKRLYVAQYAEDRVAAYNVDPSGALAAVAGSPYLVGDAPYGLAMAPDGKRLYVPGSGSDDLASYPVSPDGALGAATATVAAGSGASSPTVSSDSKFVYSGAFGVPTGFGFAAGDGGTLTALAGSPYLPLDASDFQGTAITPNQGPKASLTVIPKDPGVKEKTQFKGDGSTDSDGSVVSYVYDFGDGDTKTGTAEKPKVSHKYKKTGTYTVTLTVTDNEGCSTAVVYTGQTASCNGGPAAVATKEITVADKEVEKPKLKAKGSQKQSGKKVEVELQAGANEAVTVVGTGKVKIKGKGEQALLKVKKNVKAKQQKTLKMKLKREAANKKVFKALAASKPVKAVVQVKFTDEAGNQLVQKVPAIILK